jgi:hypothetical protein
MQRVRKREQLMRSIAIERVLADRNKRARIGSLRSLREAYQSELAAHGAEIAAEADELLAQKRKINLARLRNLRRCAVCGEPIVGAKRLNRRYCSDRCRQRAHRQREG